MGLGLTADAAHHHRALLRHSVRPRMHPLTALLTMTAPVVSDAGSTSFVMPAGTRREQTPDPLDGQGRIVSVEEQDITVIRFFGCAPPDEVDAALSRLQTGLKN